MRKFLLLCSIILMSIGAFAQKDTLYFNDFEHPNDINRLTQDTIIKSSGSAPAGVPPTWSVVDTFGYNSDSSLHLQGQPKGHVVYFQTPVFSTDTTPYISFSFWHIAKLNFLNKAQLYYSIDNGQTWQLLPINGYYSGSSVNYGVGGFDWFNTVSYGSDWAPGDDYSAVFPSWWRKETFDLSGVLSNLSLPNPQGYTNVMLRFEGNVSVGIGTTSPPLYSAGWFVDDILIEGSSCELNKPTINFNFVPQANITGYPNCFKPKPEGGIVELASGNYPVAARVTDAQKTYDTGVDTVMVVYRVNGGALDTIGLDKTTNDYRGLFNSIALGDTVEWYMLAYDFGCPPNEARMPDLTFNNTGMYLFFIEEGLPGKCGAPDCGAAPNVIRTLPWSENFQSSGWVPSDPLNTVGFIPTGDYWWRNYGNSTSDYGWAVRTGTTPSLYTGPTGDHTTGTGNYLYLESDGTPTSGPGQLQLPCIDLTNRTGCWAFEFYYHMFGSEIGDLYVDIDTGQGPSTQNFWVNKAAEITGQQQKSSADPWRRAVVDLSPYVGKYIRIRFRARNIPNATQKLEFGRNDIAIDDLRVYQPSANDAELLNVTAPENGYCDFQGKPVKVLIRNNGCSAFNSISLSYNLNGGAPVTVNATLDTTLYLSDTITYSFTGSNALPALTPGNYQLKVWGSIPSDSKPSNDTAAVSSFEYSLPITTFPLIEDFEGGTIGTQNIGNSNWIFSSGLDPNLKWQVGYEMTAERSTGPFKGYHHEGKYIYTQSNATSGKLSTYMRSKCLDFSSVSNPVLYFYYHLYGANIDNLEIQVSRENESIDTWTTVSTITSAGKQTKELDDWKLQRVDLSAYANQTIKIRFKSNRKAGGDKTNLAIDKIMIFDESSNDAGGYIIDGPRNRGITAGPNGPNDPEVSIANFGSTALNNCTINFKITLLCNPSVTNTYQYYYSGPSIASGQIKKVSLSSLPITYPVGEFQACVWVTSPNGSADANTFNDTICRNIIGANTRYSIPYKQNFDTCDYDSEGFLNAGDFWQWELGKPSVKTPNGPGLIRDDKDGGGNAWVTNIDGVFLVNSVEQLRLPTYDDFDTVKNAQLRFWQIFDFGANLGTNSDYDFAGTCLYYNQSWKILGGTSVVKNLGVNWYGGNDSYVGDPIRDIPQYDAYNNGAPLVDMLGGPGWVGNQNTNGQWQYTMYPLNNFSLDTNAALALRFQFQADDDVTQATAAGKGGWGIDNFEIYIPPQNSIAPVKVNTLSPLPLPGFEQTLNITIENTGEKTIESCIVDVTIAGTPLGASLPITFSPLAKGERYSFDFPTKWPASLVTSGDHLICVTTSRPNNKPDQIPSDDQLCKNIPVMLELDFTANGQDEYCEDFESSTSFQWISKNAKDLFIDENAWFKGAPRTEMGPAPSGNNVWRIQNEYLLNPSTPSTSDSIYDGLEQAALFSPVLEIDSGLVYNISFNHWFDTEKYHDGGNVEYSFDGGITWYPIGYVNRLDTSANWFNTEFVTALDQIRGGWTGKSNGWQFSDYRVKFLDHGKLILRFRFGSDYDIGAKGWAIDDFCFVKDTTGLNAEQEIGEGEYALPEDAVIGDMVPNPATEYSQLSFVFPTPQNVEIRVYNLVGQVMETRSSKFSEGVHTIEFNTASWSAGVYFVNFEYEGKMITRKLVVK